MNLTALQEIVSRAISKVLACDSELLERDASEWSIAHRLAVYLEQEIPGWHVDCEYNRQGPERAIKEMPTGDPEKNKIRPDIIIHHRGGIEREHNLLVVEIKKKESDSDLGKVSEYTRMPAGKRKFQYQFGLALALKPSPKMRWYVNGTEVANDGENRSQ